MSSQLEMFGEPGFVLKPEEGRDEPRLWVKRLVVWAKPGEVVRETNLRPGLNIVWSPDSADRSTRAPMPGRIGHGAGKTLFCRLLRYCLGEDRIATEEQAQNITSAFPEGFVGAEVSLDGTTWAIVRSIGATRWSSALPDTTLEALSVAVERPKNTDGFTQAVEAQLLAPSLSDLLPERRRWLTALAWLARDQECRFGTLVDWRSAASESVSPVRSFSVGALHNTLRVFLGAMNQQERDQQKVTTDLVERRDVEMQRATESTAEAKKLRAKLCAALKLDEASVTADSLGVAELRAAAKKRLAEVQGLDATSKVDSLKALEADFDEAQRLVAGSEGELRGLETQVEVLKRTHARTLGEEPGLKWEKDRAENPHCSLCEFPVDRVVAGKCGLSDRLPDRALVERKLEEFRQRVANEEQALRAAMARASDLNAGLASARVRLERLRGQRSKARALRDARDESLFDAQTLVREVERLSLAYQTQATAAEAASALDKKVEQARAKTSFQRDAVAPSLLRVSEAFGAIVRDAIGTDATGSITVDGNSRVVTRVLLGGQRSTAAIDSLKVIAFDLAAMCLSIEGGARVPAFLVHDSPREADLGLSAYHSLFRFVRRLEPAEGAPLFQYIITTTTRPPDELVDSDAHVLTLEGTPAEMRLLKRDL